MPAPQRNLVASIGRWLVCPILVWGLTAVTHAQLAVDDFEILTAFAASLGDHLGSAVAVGDFNGDGFDDLAIGIPDGQGQNGRVSIFPGHPDGLGTNGFVPADEVGVGNEPGQRFGAALATGDFDGDGLDDLAIGIPGKIVAGDDNAGEIVVVYGTDASVRGFAPGVPLDLTSAQSFSQANLAGAVESGDSLGSSLAAGDLDGDGIDDLAIGVPMEDVLSNGFGQRTDAGAVNVVYGVLGVGLTTAGNLILHQEVPGVALNVNDDDRFGFALAIGDFTGDGQADLAVGVPGEFRGGSDEAGAVEIFEGGPDGIDVLLDEQIFSQLDANILGTPQEDDEFGYALVAGDFDGNGRDDLAVGVPGESEFLALTEIGAVQVFYGFTSGLSTVLDDIVSESSGGGPYFPAAFNRFGEALAAGDFNADGRDDLAIGAPLTNYNDVVNSGSVHVYYGAGGGLSFVDDQIFSMLAFDTPEVGDRLGFALAAGRFTGTAGGEDLAVGVPSLESPGDPEERGAVVAIHSVSVFADDLETGDTSRWNVVVP